MTEWLLDQTKRAVQARASGKGSSSSKGNKGDNKSSGNNNSNNNKVGEVVVLEEANFNDLVIGSKDSWFVEFYAPWCGHCKKLEPEWNSLAKELNGEIKVAKIDATQNSALGQRFGVSGYPTIKFFPAGMTSDSQVIDYAGGRDTSSMASFARSQGE